MKKMVFTKLSGYIGMSHFLNVSLEKGLMGVVPVGNVARLFDADLTLRLLPESGKKMAKSIVLRSIGGVQLRGYLYSFHLFFG